MIKKEKILKNSKIYNDLLIDGINSIKNKKVDEAIQIFEKAININNNNSEAYINLANSYILKRSIQNSINILKNYLIEIKFNAEILNHLGKICLNYNFHEEFISIFNLPAFKKKKIISDKFYSYFLLGHIFQKEKKFSKAIEAYILSIKCNTKFFESYAKLFYLFETTNNINKLEKYTKIAEKYFIKKEYKYIINFYIALLLNRKLEFNLSEKIIGDCDLEKKLKHNKDYYVKLLDLRSKNNEKLKNFNISFKYIDKRNSTIANLKENRNIDDNKILKTINQYKIFFNSKNFRIISKIRNNDNYDSKIVFLVGFPRSGTTLLDTILRSHSKITVLEEKPYLLQARHEFFTKNNNNLNALLNITSEQKAHIRNNYFQNVNRSKIESQNLIIDKLPLSIIELGFIKSIFPKSKIILSLRHPCDVIISCYFSFFAINEAMINFLSWDKTINFYNEVFNLFEIYEKELGINTYKIKYEDIIIDFKKQIKSLLRFLDLKYEDNLEKYYMTAKKRSKIFTPSYSQVINPLYSTSINRWKNFSKIKDPYKELEKWIKKFNY